MTEPADDELILAVVRRDPAALVALYDRYRGLTFALAYRVLGDAGAAEEAVQDAFLQVWRRAASFDPGRGAGGAGVRAWLLTIVHHRAIDALRHRSARHREAVGLDQIEQTLAGPDLWSEVAAALDQAHVRSAVAALPADQRRAIELAYFEGLTHREIAERTKSPLGTIKGRLRLGLHKLHAALVDAAPADLPAGRAEPPPAAGVLPEQQTTPEPR